MCQYNAMYSDVTAPLRKILKKKLSLLWAPQCEAVIQTLKDALVSDKVVTM